MLMKTLLGVKVLLVLTQLMRVVREDTLPRQRNKYRHINGPIKEEFLSADFFTYFFYHISQIGFLALHHFSYSFLYYEIN